MVEPDGDGCVLTVTAEGDFTSRPMRLLGPLAVGIAKRQAVGDTKRLKAALGARTEQTL